MTTVTLTPEADGSPSPFILVEVDSVPATVVTLTAWRTARGRESKVRGMVGISADGASAQDFEAPPGLSLSYRVQMFDSSGELIGWSTPATTSLPDLTNAKAWFHNVFDPATAVQVTMRRQAVNDIVRPVSSLEFDIPSRSVGVVLPGVRSGVRGVVLDCLTRTLDDADRFDALFGGYDDASVAILCVRTPSAMRLPGPLIAFVGSPKQSPANTHQGGQTIGWGLTADEVAPPTEALVVALLSYADFEAFYGSFGTSDYAAFTAAYSDYTSAQRDYSIAGTA